MNGKPDYKQRVIYSVQAPNVKSSNDASQWNIKLEFPNWFIYPSDKRKYIRVSRVNFISNTSYNNWCIKNNWICWSIPKQVIISC